VDKFNEIIQKICAENLPKRPTHKSKITKIPRERKILMRKRAKLTKKLTSFGPSIQQLSIFQKIHAIERELHKSHLNSRQEEESKAVENIKKNPKYFYSFAKKYSTTKSGIGPFLDNANTIISDNSVMADMLKLQYEEVFNKPSHNHIVEDPTIFFEDLNLQKPTLTEIDFTTDDIVQAMDALSTNSAPGPDAIPAMLLKNCKYAIAVPLLSIWKKSFESGSIAQIYKNALVIPIHKGGSKATPKNYRPISLTSHIIKIFERVLRSKLAAYLEVNNLLNPTQHGFRSGRSCLSQLLQHYDHILECLERGHGVDVVYLDFAKAFDKVDHGILCHKLRQLGVGGKVGVWIHNFLQNRVQKISVNGALSADSPVISGVPQGSVLGPLLFLVHINDIDEGLSNHVSSFADDTRISSHIKSIEDVEIFQNDLNTIYNWQDINNMSSNDNKFEVLRYGKNHLVKINTSYISSNGSAINTKNSVRDLGVIMSDSATFTDHIDHIVIKSKQLIGWILRTFSRRDSLTMKTLWTSLIQPHLDYCSQLWSPHKIGDIQNLESLPRKFTSYITEVNNLNYWQRLTQLNM
jgi:hypothetical protein